VTLENSLSETTTPNPILAGESLVLTPPAILLEGITIADSGWQISNDNFSTIIDYTGQALDVSYNRYSLRYFIETEYGLSYSNVVSITVNSTNPDQEVPEDLTENQMEPSVPETESSAPKTGDDSFSHIAIFSFIAVIMVFIIYKCRSFLY